MSAVLHHTNSGVTGWRTARVTPSRGWHPN